MQRPDVLIRPPTSYYLAKAFELLLLLAVAGLLIGILVCVCQAKDIVHDIHKVVKLLESLGPCLAQEFCLPPPMV